MQGRGYISDEMFENRVICHGVITESQMAAGFRLQNGAPFSIFIEPKAATTDTHKSVDLLLVRDVESSLFPVELKKWTNGAISQLAANAIDLTDYNVFLGSSDFGEPE